jgi:acetyl-CoA carboxylase biotin carboxyl carrier protein
MTMGAHVVQSPLPGVFYRRPSPDQPPFVEVGGTVTADQTIGLVEVMKQFAEIKAGADGTVTTFSVDSEAVLGPGDAIATIATSG